MSTTGDLDDDVQDEMEGVNEEEEVNMAGLEGDGEELEQPENEEDEDDVDYEEVKKKKKTKRRTKGEKAKKKKKKKKESDEEAPIPPPSQEELELESTVEKRSSKRNKSKPVSPTETATTPTQQQQSDQNLPTVAEVCESFGLVDVEVDPGDSNLSTYKSYQQFVRPLIQKENPKMPMSKIMMLVAAKWREYSSENGLIEAPEASEAAEAVVEERGTRSKKGGSSSSGGKKKSVPTLKIKIGKRKNRESDAEEVSDKDSDAEFEQMLKEAEEVKDDVPTPGSSTSAVSVVKKKAKTKIGSKYKKKLKK